MAQDSDIQFGGRTKRNLMLGILFLIGLIFIVRLAQLQIIEGGDYLVESETQAIKRVRLEPFRGNIFDRNGTLVVQNAPSVSVTLTRNDFRESTMPILAECLELPEKELAEIIAQYKDYSRFTPVKFIRNISDTVLAKLEENIDLLPGIDIVVESKRVYEVDVSASHVLGYTREINPRQLDRMPNYRPGDVIGQTGIENIYETYLRGQNGFKIVAVNKFGQKVSSFAQGDKDIQARNGFDIHLGLDMRMQELAEELLAGRRGAVVAIDPRNGDVLINASKPDYDLRKFSGRVPTEVYRSLADDEAKPLLHRAVMSQYPPGSTWKMLIAIAALQEGIIDENSTIYCGGSYFDGVRHRACHGAHGNVNARNAIKASCNTFFYQLGMKIGYDVFGKYGKMFNFGMKTGIDLPNEKAGILPTREWLNSHYGEGTASLGRLINYGIGQGEILVTPLQMAAYTAAIANEGRYYTPHVVKSMYNNVTDKIEYFDTPYRNLSIDNSVFKLIKQAMSDVVNAAGGTARVASIPDIEVCGKTGTAQNAHGENHAWFVCFAPKEDPVIAMCVFVENSGFGGTIAAPIARELLNAFFHPDTPKADTTQVFAEN